MVNFLASVGAACLIFILGTGIMYGLLWAVDVRHRLSQHAERLKYVEQKLNKLRS